MVWTQRDRRRLGKPRIASRVPGGVSAKVWWKVAELGV